MAKKAKKAKKSNGLVTFTFQLPKALHARLKAKRKKSGEMMSKILVRSLEKSL